MQPINQVVWSFSLLERFEKCQHAAKLRFINRLKEPPVDDVKRTPSKGATTTENPLERGIRIHEGCEKYIDGSELTYPPELEAFKDALLTLRSLYILNLVEQEKSWYFNRDWEEVTSYAEAWGMMKLDVFVLSPDGRTALIIDYKTGKIDGNRVKHARQGAAYQALVFHRFPKVQSVSVEFWYVDHASISRQTYHREKAAMYTAMFNNAVTAFEMERHFRPSPVDYKCRYCGYRINGCDYAITE